MSGRSKQIAYYIFLAVVTLCGAAGTALLAYFGLRFADLAAIFVLLAFCVCIFLFPLHTVLHEAGHALCGTVCGMRAVALSVGCVRFDWSKKFTATFSLSPETSGAAALLPRNSRGVRGKLIFALIGGALFNFIYGAVFLALFFVLPHSPALIFFILFAPLNLCEGLLALYPVELTAGKTDGKFALDLIKKRPDAELSLRVMTAQGALYRKTYAELPHDLLSDVPVVREDSTAFLALLQLRYRAHVSVGDPEAAAEATRLQSLFGYLPAASRGEVAADLVCASYLFPETADWGEKYEGQARGDGIREVALYAYERTEENEARARKAIAAIKLYGERAYLESLLALLKKKDTRHEADVS